MNIKNILLASILTFSATVVKPNETAGMTAIGTIGCDTVQFIPANKRDLAWQTYWNFDALISTTLTSTIPGILVGGFTGAAISYLSGTLFDAAANNIAKLIINHNALLISYNNEGHYGFATFDNATLQKSLPAVIALVRLTVQIGSKWYWEKPLRAKIMNWIQEDLTARGVEFNAELMKTVARVSAWLGTVLQVKSA